MLAMWYVMNLFLVLIQQMPEASDTSSLIRSLSTTKLRAGKTSRHIYDKLVWTS